MSVSRIERIVAYTGLFVFSGALLPLLRAQTGFSYEIQEGDRFLQAVFASFYLFAFLMLLRAGGQHSRTLPQALVSTLRTHGTAQDDRLARVAPALLWAPLAFAAASTLWSADPWITARRLAGLLGATIFGIYLGKRFDIGDLLLAISVALGAAVVSSYLIVVFLPSVGIMSGEHEGAWSGAFIHKNALGRMAVLALITLALLLWRHRLALAAACIPIAYLVLQTQSVTSMLALAGVCGLFVLRWSATGSRARAFAIGAGAAVSLAVTLMIGPLDLVSRGPTLTGRTRIWAALPEALMERPWIGHGYQAFWNVTDHTTSTIPSRIGWAPEHAHNGYLDFVLEVGVIGGALWLSALVMLLLLTRGDGLTRASAQGIVVYILILNVAESTMTRPNSLLWICVVALFTIALRRRRAPGQDHHQAIARPTTAARHQ